MNYIIDLCIHILSFSCLPPVLSSDDNLSEDDLNECEKEDPLNESDTVPHDGSDSKKKRKKEDISVR